MISTIISLSIVCLLKPAMASTGTSMAPYPRSINEIKTIVESAELAKSLGSGVQIISINKTRDNGYALISSNDCEISVSLSYPTPTEPGNAEQNKLKLSFGPKVCLSSDIKVK